MLLLDRLASFETYKAYIDDNELLTKQKSKNTRNNYDDNAPIMTTAATATSNTTNTTPLNQNKESSVLALVDSVANLPVAIVIVGIK